MKTSELFTKEINFIANETLQKIVIDTLNSAPECIQVIPASSSGKYHPKADIVIGSVNDDGTVEIGGLVNHTKTVTYIAKSLMDSNIFRDIALGVGADDNETLIMYQDIALTACILHDCMKPDDTLKHHTKFEHPLLAAKLFKKCATPYINSENMEYMRIVIPLVYSCIASHMGQWSTAPYARGIVLPEPKLGIEIFVHLCDYVASRKFIDFDFKKFYEAKSNV